MEKKLLVTIILVVIASLSIAGCTTSSTPVSQTPTAAASSASSPTPSVGTQTQATPTSSPTSVPTTPQLTVATPAEIAALPTTPPANFQSYTGPFVGSIKSDVYHYPWCSEAQKILPENLVIFPTVADACAAGYRPCEVCKPPACGSPTPTPTPTPSSSIQVIISGPTTLRDGQGATWTATVLVNGVALPQSQLTNQIDWFIDGHAAGGSWGPGTLTTDANGSMTTWAPNGVHTLNAEYLGDPSLPNTSITVTVVAS
ncbi:MAG: Ada metal-binding domain-containing protein [Halobacteriota archaeon]